MVIRFSALYVMKNILPVQVLRQKCMNFHKLLSPTNSQPPLPLKHIHPLFFCIVIFWKICKLLSVHRFSPPLCSLQLLSPEKPVTYPICSNTHKNSKFHLNFYSFAPSMKRRSQPITQITNSIYSNKFITNLLSLVIYIRGCKTDNTITRKKVPATLAVCDSF
jgi:hypothetical protein